MSSHGAGGLAPCEECARKAFHLHGADRISFAGDIDAQTRTALTIEAANAGIPLWIQGEVTPKHIAVVTAGADPESSRVRSAHSMGVEVVTVEDYRRALRRGVPLGRRYTPRPTPKRLMDLRNREVLVLGRSRYLEQQLRGVGANLRKNIKETVDICVYTPEHDESRRLVVEAMGIPTIDANTVLSWP